MNLEESLTHCVYMSGISSEDYKFEKNGCKT